MKVIRFGAYDPNAADGGAVQARAWVILWSAVGAFPAGNKEQSQVGHEAWIALREASEESPGAPDHARRLKISGADIYLEDAEFRLVNQAVEKIRDQIRIANVDALLHVDHLLDKAPEISKDAYKNGQRLE